MDPSSSRVSALLVGKVAGEALILIGEVECYQQVELLLLQDGLVVDTVGNGPKSHAKSASSGHVSSEIYN